MGYSARLPGKLWRYVFNRMYGFRDLEWPIYGDVAYQALEVLLSSANVSIQVVVEAHGFGEMLNQETHWITSLLYQAQARGAKVQVIMGPDSGWLANSEYSLMMDILFLPKSPDCNFIVIDGHHVFALIQTNTSTWFNNRSAWLRKNATGLAQRLQQDFIDLSTHASEVK